MRAAVYEEFRGAIEVGEVADPSPSLDGVVLRVLANGICRSDWHGWMGHDADIVLPHVPGHELAGEVVACGTDVERFSIGDLVTVPFVLGCGACPECGRGNEHICDRQYQPGFTGWGAFAEYVALPYADRNLVALPDGITPVTAAGLGCRFSTAYRAIVDQGRVCEGTTVAIWGCGGVGLSAVMIASALGATVIAVDTDPAALQFADRLGAAHLVPGGAGAGQAVRDLSGGGVDVGVDALGATTTAVASIESLRKQGRHVQVGLLVGPDEAPEIPMWRLHANEIEITGSHGMQAHRYPEMLHMVADGRLDPSSLVTGTVSLREGVDHLTRMAGFPGTGFVVIDDFTA